MTLQKIRTGVLLMGTALILGACAAGQTPAKTEKEELTQERAESISTAYYSGEMRSDTLKEELTQALADLKPAKEGEKVKTTDEVNVLIATYLDGAVLNAEKYNEILATLATEIQLFEKEEKINVVKGENIDNLPEGTVKGFLQDIEKHNLKLTRKDDVLEVIVNYDAVESEFGTYLTVFQENVIKVQRDIQEKPFYDYENGIIDFENVLNRLTLLDGIQDGDAAKDDQYWEGERYFYYASLLGFSDSTMTNAEGKLSETALNAMKELVKSNADNPYVKDLQQVVASLEKEKAYGVETITLANKFINDNFKDYIAHVEKQEQQATEEATAEAEAKAKVEAEKTEDSSKSKAESPEKAE